MVVLSQEKRQGGGGHHTLSGCDVPLIFYLNRMWNLRQEVVNTSSECEYFQISLTVYTTSGFKLEGL